jgi:hypothetical protein
VVRNTVVRANLRSYSVVVLHASTFAVTAAVTLGGSCPANADIGRQASPIVQGFVLATDSCQLAPVTWSGVCSSSIVPIAGHLHLRSRSTARGQRTERVTVELNEEGVFTKRVKPGTYRVRLIDPRIADRSLKRSAYRIYPKQIRISNPRGGLNQTYSQSSIFIVAHKSREAPPAVGIGGGFAKGS